MLISGNHYQSIKYVPRSQDGYGQHVIILDQRCLPFQVKFEKLYSSEDVIQAISEMHLRGAPLIGITAAFGVVFACSEAIKSQEASVIKEQAKKIISARPTAVNTENLINYIMQKISKVDTLEKKEKTALHLAKKLIEEDIEACRMIGKHGLDIIRTISETKAGPVNILTHCNAGWLACVDYGTATSPIYLANKEGIKIHVWVDETRPRNQGSRLTVWELTENGINNTLITDNAGGYLMQKGMVDLVLVGSDRTTITGNVANKIGTYLKALAAKDNNIPFWVALPGTTFDNDSDLKPEKIKIEERSSNEVSHVEGLIDNQIRSVLISCDKVVCSNPSFDITPSRLVTGLITERGLCKASKQSILKLFPEKITQKYDNEK